MKIRADEAEIGQEIYYEGLWHPTGWYRIMGWFWPSKGGGIVLEFDFRFHTYPRSEKIEVRGEGLCVGPAGGQDDGDDRVAERRSRQPDGGMCDRGAG